ncbi:hypothetical protein EMIHUDRAFT_71404, partial [Emiliania huxleyi CCMP1516]|uniref:Protein kinase domain-containing protein n=2 Tax=Emiliania huxleyi TaxID=2903 RepID=A0A0D3J6S0_EMIH1
MLLAEVAILSAVPPHPGLVRLLQVACTPAAVALNLEYICGGDLFAYILEAGGLDEAEARPLFAQIVAALEHLRAHGICHRDVKPENCCFADPMRRVIKVVDLGAAAFISSAGFTSLAGTPLYAAPEICPVSGSLQPYGAEVDLWALGATLYVMLSGEPPYDQSLEERISRASPYVLSSSGVPMSSAAWRGVSNEAMRLILSLMSRRPESRPAYAAVRAHPW